MKLEKIEMKTENEEIIFDDTCAKILAWLYCVGIRDERTTQPKVFEIIQIAQDRANFHAHKEPVFRIQIKINNYIKEFERGNKEFINEVEQLLQNAATYKQ